MCLSNDKSVSVRVCVCLTICLYLSVCLSVQKTALAVILRPDSDEYDYVDSWCADVRRELPKDPDVIQVKRILRVQSRGPADRYWQ